MDIHNNNIVNVTNNYNYPGKVCSRCKIYKSFEEYHKDKSMKDGARSCCKLCSKEYRKLYYQNNQEKEKETAKLYRETHQEEVKELKKYREIRIKIRQKSGLN